jgi:hypothetical protein
MADECAGSGKIGEGEKNFSVVLAKAAGMAAQSFNDIGCAVISRNSECAAGERLRRRSKDVRLPERRRASG